MEADEAGPRRYRDPQNGITHVQIMQGESYVTGRPDEVLTTILGSCIAACIRDPVLGVGGMNHFLLPEGRGDDAGAQRFGVNAMELLINRILGQGGDRGRLEAKLFGGANVIAALSDVGARNAAFALRFLKDEGVLLTSADMGGTAPRRVQFWPASGRARRLTVRTDTQALAESEIRGARAETAAGDDVELF